MPAPSADDTFHLPSRKDTQAWDSVGADGSARLQEPWGGPLNPGRSSSGQCFLIPRKFSGFDQIQAN